MVLACPELIRHGARRTAQFLPREYQWTMIKFTKAQRVLLADKLPDTANLAAGVLIFSQFISEHPLSPRVMVVGFLTWSGFMLLSLFFAEN